MQNTLIDNSASNLTMTSILRRCISSAGLKEIKIATGYWDIPGISLVVSELRAFLEQDDAKLKLVIGREMLVYANQVLTPLVDAKFPQEFMKQDMDRLNENIKPEYQDALRLLLKGCESGKIEIRKYEKDAEGKPQFLHSKCYIFNGVSAEGEKFAYGIIGSSNFTEQGLKNYDKEKGNRELNYLETNKQIVNFKDTEDDSCKGHNQWFDEIWELASPWEQEYLEQVLKPAKATQELPPEKPQVTSLTPYEAYIRLLNDKFGALTNDDMEAVLESYLPKKIRPFKFQMDAAILCHQVMHQHGGFLLGDVVGLGKTIVGVLVLKYYLDTAEDEGRARKALIIVPPAIKSSWEKTIAQFDEDKEDKIAQYVDFVTTGSIGKLVEEGDDDVEEESEDFSEELKHEPYGLIVIDESHNFRNRGTQKYEMLEDLIEEINLQAGYYPYIGLLSATIQNNSPEDLRNQIYLFQRHPKESTLAVEGHNLDYFFVQACDRYRKIISEHPTGEQEKQTNQNALIYLSQEIHDKVLAELLVRRTRTDIKNDYKEDLDFPVIKGPVKLEYKMNRRLSQLFYDSMELIAPKPEAINLGEPGIVYMRYRATEYLNPELQKRYSGRNMSPEKSSSHLARIMQMLLVKRLESSITAFRESLENLQRYTRNMIQMWDDDCIFICPSIDVNAELNLKAKQKRSGNTHYTKEQCYEDIRNKIAKLTKEGRNAKHQNAEYRRSDFNPKYYDLLVEDVRYIDELVMRWKDEHTDPKLDRFKLAIYTELFDKENNRPQKLVVFSEAIATVNEIADALEDAGKRVLKITAANRNEKEKTIRANFDANYEGEWQNDYDAIVTTEVLAEGVNLHRANTILNYDTPWNSTRLIQRIGRVNRIGSMEKEVFVYNFFPSSEGNDTLNLVQRAFTKLQSFHTLFGEDNRIYSDEEQISHVAYMKLIDGQETPFTKYITELHTYKQEYPERFEYINSVEAPIYSSFQSEVSDSLFVVKTDLNRTSSQYVRIPSNAPQGIIIPCLEMFQQCACTPETASANIARNEAKEQIALDAYNLYTHKLTKAAASQNKFITAARGFIRTFISTAGLSPEAKQRLNIASTVIGKGDVALARKVCRLEQQYKDIQLSLFESSDEEKMARVNAIVEEELKALNRQMIERHGKPYIYFGLNKESK